MTNSKINLECKYRVYYICRTIRANIDKNKTIETMKDIKIICNECGHEFESIVEDDYVFSYEEFTCPKCDTYENLFEISRDLIK